MGDGSLGNANVGMRGDGSHTSFGRNMATPRNARLLHSAVKEGNSEVNSPTPLVFVIDDDESVRKGLKRLLRSANYESEVFKSASVFLERPPHPGPACVIVDVQMPGINGIDFQQALIQRRREEQLVFITGYGTIPICTRVMKAGAVDFLPKPFNSRELLKCVEQALHRSAEQRRCASERNEARRLLDLLTPREFEVMQLVIRGMLNKQVGGELGVAEKTVKVHRGRLMQKLGVTSVAELVQLVQKAKVSSPARSETKV
jgi:FixJ family two-component response regulator